MIQLPNMNEPAWTPNELAEEAGVTGFYIRKLLRGERKKSQIFGLKIGQTWLIPDGEARRFLAMKRKNQQEPVVINK